MEKLRTKSITFAGKTCKVGYLATNWICDGKEGWDGSSMERSYDVVLNGGYKLGRCSYGPSTGCKFVINGREYANEKRMFEGELERLSCTEEWSLGEVSPFITM